jgi:putative spermidine/putrescine transport system ATP-binding protein
MLATPAARDESPDTRGNATSSATVLDLRDVSVDYGSNRVLHQVDLAVGAGELIALLGPSGSGKTTIIRAIAGFITPSNGTIELHGHSLVNLPVHRRDIGMVFQSYALFPHMTVRDNIAYALKVQRKGATHIRSRVDELIELVQLTDHAEKRPAKLSGGQQQRVALARALAMDPKLLLLDEPLSNLDANLRREVGEEIRQLQQRTGTTTIMVTHDRQEAFGMADRIAVLQGGRIRQLDTPEAIYRRPVSAFMATFVGDANLLPVLEASPSPVGSAITTPIGVLDSRMTGQVGGTALVRPEDIHLGDFPGRGIPATVTSSYYYGSSIHIELDIEGTALHVTTSGAASGHPVAGDRVTVTVRPEDIVLLAPEGDR